MAVSGKISSGMKLKMNRKPQLNKQTGCYLALSKSIRGLLFLNANGLFNSKMMESYSFLLNARIIDFLLFWKLKTKEFFIYRRASATWLIIIDCIIAIWVISSFWKKSCPKFSTLPSMTPRRVVNLWSYLLLLSLKLRTMHWEIIYFSRNIE